MVVEFRLVKVASRLTGNLQFCVSLGSYYFSSGGWPLVAYLLSFHEFYYFCNLGRPIDV